MRCSPISPIPQPLIHKHPIFQPTTHKAPISQPLKPQTKGPRKNLQVKFRDEFIKGNDQAQVFVNTVKEIGIQKVRNLGMSFGIDLVSDKKDSPNLDRTRKYSQQFVEGYWICTHMSAIVKKNTLEKIAQELGGLIEVKIL